MMRGKRRRKGRIENFGSKTPELNNVRGESKPPGLSSVEERQENRIFIYLF